MRPTLPRTQDFWAGILFLAVAGLTIWLARDYPLGTASRMKSGFYPMLLAGVLCLVGIVLAVRGWFQEGPAVESGSLRPFLAMVGVVAFALLLQPAGLVIATTALIGIGAFAGRDSRLVETICAIVVLTAFAAAVFVWGLGLPITLFPR